VGTARAGEGGLRPLKTLKIIKCPTQWHPSFAYFSWVFKKSKSPKAKHEKSSFQNPNVVTTGTL